MLETTHFGLAPGGCAANLYLLKNSKKMQVAVTDYGAAIVRVWAPDRWGEIGDVVLGYDDVHGYISDKNYLGGTIGRYANRIAGASFVLDGRTFALPKNDGENCLHGGLQGFNKRLWQVSARSDRFIQMQYESPNGEEGFPGALQVSARFALSEGNELRIEYSATTDQPTIVNLTSHSYFDLSAGRSPDILGHELRLNAEEFTPVDASLIPTGELQKVTGTPFDFTEPHAIGERIAQPDQQLEAAGGYDHNFKLRNESAVLVKAAAVYDPLSGRELSILTTEPGLQFYSGNLLDGATGKAGAVYTPRSGFCLEAQHFPDSPHHPEFPSTTLRPGERFESVTVYRFTAR